ncbi:MAG: RNA polymerase sigma-70 factor [Bacteroidota bacterium]
MDNTDSTCDKSAFRQLYENFSDRLRNFVYYKTGRAEIAEDTVQESFLRLWKNCASVPYPKAQQFLYTVAQNLLRDRFKHEKVVLKFRHQHREEASAESPQYLLEEKEFKQKLERAINALPEGQRLVFLMNRIDKRKYREIAEELGISQKAVEKRMHQALVTLRKELGKI